MRSIIRQLPSSTFRRRAMCFTIPNCSSVRSYRMACLSLRAHTLLQTLYPLLFLMRSSASFILINVNASIIVYFFVYCRADRIRTGILFNLVGWDCHSPITKHCPFASYISMITMSGATPLIASICSSITLFLYSSIVSLAPADTRERDTSRPSTSA